MSQNITLMGASYSAVPAVTLPKTGGGTASFTDVTDTTAAAEDVASGKYFYTAAGVRTQGTSSGGGGGAVVITDTTDTHGGIIRSIDTSNATLVASPLSVTQNGTYTATSGTAYSQVFVNVSGGGGGYTSETGTWTPAEDIAKTIISFSNSHTVAPFFYVIADVTETNSSTTNDNLAITYVNTHQIFGASANYGSTVNQYGLVTTRYKSSQGGTSGNVLGISYPYTDSGDSTIAYSRFWATETGITASTNSSSRYWRAGRTYKWFALWAS